MNCFAVTCAKSIANGFPMAVLITTPKIAETMKSAVTFNTYGGNPMACSAASAVLDVSCFVFFNLWRNFIHKNKFMIIILIEL